MNWTMPNLHLLKGKITTVTNDSAIQRYMKRPMALDTLSIYEVLTDYAWRRSAWRKRKEKTNVVVRVYPRFSPNPEGDHYEDFCRTSRSMSRTQVSLRLAWAVTVHKSQGLILPKIRLGLGKREFSTGLTFVALSRVKALDDL